MADLIHNATIRIEGGKYKGLWRVVVADSSSPWIVAGKLPEPTQPTRRPPKRQRKLIQVAQFRGRRKKEVSVPLEDLPRDELLRLQDRQLLTAVSLSPPVRLRAEEQDLNDAGKRRLKNRREIAKPFLDRQTLGQKLSSAKGLGSLIAKSMESSGCARSSAYRVFAALCLWGFDERSLNTRLDLCGGKGKRRPAEGGRSKAGRKTEKERLNLPEPNPQPGYTLAWLTKILAMDSLIASPKPKFSERCELIQKGFVTDYVDGPDGPSPAPLVLGGYPNDRQIRHALDQRDELVKLAEQTTTGHFARNLAGRHGRNWKGTSGPGHTYAIDSTIGDVYLRSSLNRAWIIGRPIVYVLVDVWSTAVVGFHVCLTGPSWDTAQVALFSTLAGPETVGQMWGFNALSALNPLPQLPGYLLCDRGEYLCVRSREMAGRHGFRLQYAAPRRPDWKGIVEVLHRIMKDRQYRFVYGAFDARRKELELKPNAKVSALTLREFVVWLSWLFLHYNLHARREHRTDADMKALGVAPCPAGLWRYGYEAGIGYAAKFIERADLLTSFLPRVNATVNGSGIFLKNLLYESNVAVRDGWTTIAGNRGSFKIPVNYFPGALKTIWTPSRGGSGLLDLTLSDQALAAPGVSLDEYLDSAKVEGLGVRQRLHDALNASIAGKAEIERMMRRAKDETAAAEAAYGGPALNVTEARALEVGLSSVPLGHPQPTIKVPDTEADRSAAELEYAEYMQSILDEAGQ